jgi:hypothetical protein
VSVLNQIVDGMRAFTERTGRDPHTVFLTDDERLALRQELDNLLRQDREACAFPQLLPPPPPTPPTPPPGARGFGRRLAATAPPARHF